jgi:hypothetical protein
METNALVEKLKNEVAALLSKEQTYLASIADLELVFLKSYKVVCI